MGADGSVLAGLFRFVLILLNIVFVLIGLACMSCGIVVKFFLGSILQSSLLKGAIQEVYDQINKGQQVPKHLDFGAFTNEAGLALIIIGVILFGVSLFACCGACYKWRPFLIVFCFLLTILVIGEIAATSLLASKSSPVHAAAKKELVKQLKDYKVEGTNGFSATLNLLMFGMNCCGINGQDDFKDLSLKYKGDTAKVPPSCCKLSNTTSNISIMSCWENPTPANSNTQGCYMAFLNLLSAANKWAIPIVVCIMLVQILEVVFAGYVIRDIGKTTIMV